MPENTFSAFHEIAWRVDALVRDAAIMQRFRAMICRWYLDVNIRDSENKVLERRRDEHIDAILATPQLRDKSAGPPQPEWEWWQTVRSNLANDTAGWPHQIVYVKGWAPPELIHDELEQYWPLPLSKRPLRIEEKHTLLAAVHDHFCEGVEKIRPWPDQVQDDSVKAYVESTLYRQIVSDVAGLTVRDRPAIETFLADVEDDLAKPSAGEEPAAQSGPANSLVELLVKLELAKLQRARTITTTGARRLLDDSEFRSEMLRSRYSDPKAASHKDLTFSATERQELHDFASGEMSFPDRSVTDKVHGAMVLATDEVEKEVRQREEEDYVEAGGSIVDWPKTTPLSQFVLERIEVKLSELSGKPHPGLHIFITRTIGGRAAKHEDVRWALDRLVRDGFADELLRDVWERYPIEAELLRSPTPSETPPSEALRQPQQSQTSDGNRVGLGVHIQNILVVQSQGSRPDQSSDEPNEQAPAPERTRNDQVTSLATPVAAKLDDDAWLTHKDIAQRLGLDDEMVRKRLDRFRAKNHDCFREVSDRKPREPGYLYHVKAIRPVIHALAASSQSSSERPAK